MFPNGWPGRGLLLLRLVTGTLLIHDGFRVLLGAPQWRGVILQAAVVAAGALLICGLWTPVAGAVVAIVELWMAVSSEGALRDRIILASLGTALAMLGPGLRSIDARLFGRKRIDLRDRYRGSKSPR
jgi:putative oxidoreductase